MAPTDSRARCALAPLSDDVLAAVVANLRGPEGEFRPRNLNLDRLADAMPRLAALLGCTVEDSTFRSMPGLASWNLIDDRGWRGTITMGDGRVVTVWRGGGV